MQWGKTGATPWPVERVAVMPEIAQHNVEAHNTLRDCRLKESVGISVRLSISVT